MVKKQNHKIMEVIKQIPQHIYQILTKRENIMYEYFKGRSVPSNVWLEVNVENQAFVYRIDTLRKIACSVRFISFEPLVGSVFKKYSLGNCRWGVWEKCEKNLNKMDRRDI